MATEVLSPHIKAKFINASFFILSYNVLSLFSHHCTWWTTQLYLQDTEFEMEETVEYNSRNTED